MGNQGGVTSDAAHSSHVIDALAGQQQHSLNSSVEAVAHRSD